MNDLANALISLGMTRDDLPLNEKLVDARFMEKYKALINSHHTYKRNNKDEQKKQLKALKEAQALVLSSIRAINDDPDAFFTDAKAGKKPKRDQSSKPNTRKPYKKAARKKPSNSRTQSRKPSGSNASDPFGSGNSRSNHTSSHAHTSSQAWDDNSSTLKKILVISSCVLIGLILLMGRVLLEGVKLFLQLCQFSPKLAALLVAVVILVFAVFSADREKIEQTTSSTQEQDNHGSGRIAAAKPTPTPPKSYQRSFRQSKSEYSPRTATPRAFKRNGSQKRHLEDDAARSLGKQGFSAEQSKPAPRSPPTYGYVQVHSHPWSKATLYFDNEIVFEEYAPFEKKRIKTGRYELVLHRGAQSIEIENVDVEENSLTFVSVNFLENEYSIRKEK